MLRVEVRTESPLGLPQRSGAIVLDLHEIEVEIRDAPLDPTPPKKARFGGSGGKTLKEIATVSWRSGLLSHTGPAGEHPNLHYSTLIHVEAEIKAKGILSIRAFHQGANDGLSSSLPRLFLRSSESTAPEQKTTTMEVLIPFVGVDIGKPALDSLQLWADDITQRMERALSDDWIPTDSRGTSIIGSRYFERRTASVVESEVSGRTDQRSELAIKLVISEGANTSKISTNQPDLHSLASVNLNIPRKDSMTSRPLRLHASDLEALIEVKPEGKVRGNNYVAQASSLNHLPFQDETVITVGLMDLLIEDVTKDTTFKLLSLTSPRSLVCRSAALYNRF